MKTLEYSIRSVANEIVVAWLDYESRFVGKESIGMFANRFGKSGMAVVMAVLADRATLDQLSLASSVFSVLWFVVSLQVVNVIVSKTTEEEEKETLS
jgi:ATP/ADP translocase